MEKLIYSHNQGLGIILDDLEQEIDYFIPREMLVVDTVLMPGEMTDLFGIYTEPLRYVGVMKGDEKCMVFYLGDDADLFSSRRYYSCFYWISETRILNKYKEGTVRDYQWIDGRWK